VIVTVAAGDRKSHAMKRTLRAIHPHWCGRRSWASRTDTKLREKTSCLCCAAPPNAGVTATRRLSSEYQWPRAGPCEVDGASVGRENSGKVARTEDPVAASTRGLWHWRL